MTVVTIDGKECEFKYNSNLADIYGLSFGVMYKDGWADFSKDKISFFNLPLKSVSHDGDLEDVKYADIEAKSNDVKEFFDLVAYISKELKEFEYDIHSYMVHWGIFDEKYLYE